MLNNFDVYLLDFDGTLVDSHDSLVKVFQGAYAAVGVEVPESYILRLMRVQLGVGYKELNAPMDKTQIFGNKILELLDDVEIAKLTKTFMDVVPLLKYLKSNNKKIGIVTSNNVKHVNLVLDLLGLNKNDFDVVVGNQEVKRHKPFPDPILKACESFKTTDKVCYIGDAMDDVNSAIAANVTPILLDRFDEYNDFNGNKIKTLREIYE